MVSALVGCLTVGTSVGAVLSKTCLVAQPDTPRDMIIAMAKTITSLSNLLNRQSIQIFTSYFLLVI